MHIGEISTVQTICCKRDETVQGAALLMRKNHVGDLVVVELSGELRVPVGIVTDRDIVVSVIALGLDPSSLLVGDIMSDDLLEFLAEEMGELSRISSHQQAHEKRARQ